ncbi:hypothetical protein HOY80DRAFT_992537, partial [Tuber brumale]
MWTAFGGAVPAVLYPALASDRKVQQFRCTLRIGIHYAGAPPIILQWIGDDVTDADSVRGHAGTGNGHGVIPSWSECTAPYPPNHPVVDW